MRVIGGKAKGHRLKMVRSARLRPTSDLVREAIFSMIESLGISWDRALDLFAGTGAMGIEALSRGASWADFVEQQPRFCRLIAENLKNTGLEQQGKVHCSKVEHALKNLSETYSVIFLDPPYEYPHMDSIFEAMKASSITNERTIIVVEHSHRTEVPNEIDQFALLKNRRHGDTCISIYGQEDTL